MTNTISYKTIARFTLFIALFLFTTESITAATIKVPQDYATIQEAIDAASPSDKIRVREGTYVENININKSIQVRGTANARIVAADDSQPAVRISATDATFRRFEVRGGRGVLIEFAGTGVTLDRLLVSASLSEGITLNGGEGCHVKKCKSFENIGAGILLSGSIQPDGNVGYEVKSCSIDRNGSQGIKLLDSSGGVIQRCKIAQNGRDGILIDNSSDVTLLDNDSSSNAAAGYRIIAASVRIIVDGNKATGNVYDGYVFGRSTGVATDNTAKDNGDSGFWCSDETTWRFENNRSENNAEHGFLLDGPGNEYVGNKSLSNSGAGFYVSFGGGNLIQKNLAKNNTSHGFFIDGHYENTVDNNVSEKNGGDGFRAAEFTTGHKLTKNLASKNTGYGFVDEGSNLWDDNSCKDNDAGPSLPSGLCKE